MGRKTQSKNNPKKRDGKDKFSSQKRRDLSLNVDKLLKLTSFFQTTNNVNKSWEHYLEITALLKEITNLEYCKSSLKSRKSSIDKFIEWLKTNGAEFEGVEVSEFDGYDLGLKATKPFKEGSLMLTVPRKLMMTELDAWKSELSAFIEADPLLQNMPNITLTLFLLLEKNKPDSFWSPYINILPEKYSTILYFGTEELAALRPSPVFESSLKLYRSIARQYAYFYNKIHTTDLPVLKMLRDVFTFDSYRWAVSTVMTRQNHLQVSGAEVTGFIPLWDMCNHEQGKLTTDYDDEKERGVCYALRDLAPGEQVFIFYGPRSNADLFLHNGFVYPNNQHDSLTLVLGVSAGDPLREARLSLLNKLGVAGTTHFALYKGDTMIRAELLAFIRIFNMNKEELEKWSSVSMPSELLSSDPTSAEAVGADIDRRAYTYLLTRCKLLKASYKMDDKEPDTQNRKNIMLLKQCEVQILEHAIQYLDKTIKNEFTPEPTSA